MSLRALAVCGAAATSFALPVAAFAQCEVVSGPRTAALVELYTSEGCSSCPPADQQLTRLRQALDPTAQAVPLALHVPYWDYIGWKDPYAQRAFGDRQNRLARLNGQTVVYTPQFFVGGADLRSTHASLRDVVRRVNAMEAPAAVHLRASLAPGGALALRAEATSRRQFDPAALFVAVAENGLASKVTRGENAGATLSHDHVVREWIGPVPLSGGTARVQREIPVAAAWNSARLEVAAFVQDERSGRVLQAIRVQPCTGS